MEKTLHGKLIIKEPGSTGGVLLGIRTVPRSIHHVDVAGGGEKQGVGERGPWISALREPRIGLD